MAIKRYAFISLYCGNKNVVFAELHCLKVRNGVLRYACRLKINLAGDLVKCRQPDSLEQLGENHGVKSSQISEETLPLQTVKKSKEI